MTVNQFLHRLTSRRNAGLGGGGGGGGGGEEEPTSGNSCCDSRNDGCSRDAVDHQTNLAATAAGAGAASPGAAAPESAAWWGAAAGSPSAGAGAGAKSPSAKTPSPRKQHRQSWVGRIAHSGSIVRRRRRNGGVGSSPDQTRGGVGAAGDKKEEDHQQQRGATATTRGYQPGLSARMGAAGRRGFRGSRKKKKKKAPAASQIAPSATQSVSTSESSPTSSGEHQQRQQREKEEEIPIYVDEENDPDVKNALLHCYRCPFRGPDGVCSCLKDRGGRSENNNGEIVVDTDAGDDFQNKLTRAVAALDRSGNECFAAGDYDQAMVRYERALILKKTTLVSATSAEVGDEGDGSAEAQQQQQHAAAVGAASPTPSSPAAASVGGATAASAAATSTNNSSTPRSTSSNSNENLSTPPKSGGSSGGGIGNNSGRSPEETAAQTASIMASVATSINNMTYLKQRAGLATTEETMASYVKSLQIKRDILGSDHLSVGKTLNNIGSVFYLKREYEPALKAYQDARQIMVDRLGCDHCDVGTVMSNIGDVYYATDRKDEALEHYRGALDIRWRNLGAQDPKVIRLMKQVASLETGKQPEKDDDDLSLSENWDESGGSDGNGSSRDNLFHTSFKDLSAELENDMRYFDLVEREMAVSMIKDKMKIFREMRDLYASGGDDDDSDDYESDEYADEDDYFCMPITPKESGTVLAMPQTFEDSDADEKVAVDKMMVGGGDDVDNHDTVPAAAAPSSEAQSRQESDQEEVDTEEGESSPPSQADIGDEGALQQQLEEKEPGVAGEGGAVVPRESDASPAEEEPPTVKDVVDTEVAMTESMATTDHQDHSQSEQTSVPSRSGSEHSSVKSYRGASGLSAEQRKEALNTVRSRLAQLRAERSSFSESTDDSGDIIHHLPHKYETKKKSYMFPTVASAAKQVSTSHHHHMKADHIEL